MEPIKFANKYIFKNKKILIIYIILCVLLSILGMITPMISATILDLIIEKTSINSIFNICLILFLIGITSLVLSYVKNLIFIKISSYSAINLNIDIIKHIHQVPIRFISSMNSAYLNHRINTDSNEIINFTLSLYSNFIQSLLILTISSIILISINIKMFLISIILAVFSLIIYNLLKKRLYRFNIKLKESQNNFFSELNDQLFYIKFIKINSISDWFINKLKSSFNSYFNIRIKYEKFSCIFDNINGIIVMIAQFIFFILGAIEVLNGSISIGIFTVMTTYFNSLKDSISYFSSLAKSYQTNVVSYKRLKELLKIPSENHTGKLITSIDEIFIDNLSFKYENNEIIKDFTFTFSKGNVYGIFGKNGSGKSTLIDILLGLHNNFEGEIFINNDSIKIINISKARELCFGVCEQEPMLISDSIYNNILLNTAIDNLKLDELINLLNLNEFINKDNKNIDSIIDPYCTNLSGGEKQKISILRTLLKQNTSVLIFDEPTSALDYKSKVNLTNYLKKIKHNKIIIIISHDYEIKDMVDESILL